MDTLLERTRTACLERARRVRRMLGATSSPTDPSLNEALTELHAIKGEAAMGGLRAIGRLAHALESLLERRRRKEPLYLDDACDALRIMAELLSSTSVLDPGSTVEIEDLSREVEAAGQADAAQPAPPAAGGHEPELAQSTAASSRVPAASSKPGRVNGAEHSNWCRVDARSVHDLSHLVSEVAADVDGARQRLAALAPTARTGNLMRGLEALGEELDTIRARVAQAEERAWSLRLVAVHPSLEDLAEYVEGLARQLGKQVRTEVDAGGVALERSVMDGLREPLLHLARNAIDHGIEMPERRGSKPVEGRVRFQAGSHGSEILLAVEDDGVGLDPEAVRRRAVAADLLRPERAPLLSRDEALDLIFLHGFTQCDQVSELSGRGVGLAAARRKVEGLGGAIRVTSLPSGGARFEIVLPAAVARERVLVVESAGLCWAIPSRWVRAALREPEVLVRARRDRMLRTQDGVFPVRPLNAWLGAAREEDTAVLVLDIAGRRAGLLVTRIHSEVDLLRTPADPLLAGATRVAASGILSDGRAALFLRWAEVLRELAGLTDDESAATPRAAPRRARVLVVDDSAVIRDIVGEVLTSAGMAVTAVPDGRAALATLADEKFDLVITDIEMPRMNGLELLQQLRQQDAVLPVIMLTTRSKPEHRREAALLGANAYIAKSEFHGDTLMQVVRRFVDLPA